MPDTIETMSPIWWDKRALGLDQCVRLGLGPLDVWLLRQREQWQVAYDSSASIDVDPIRGEFDVGAQMPEEPPRHARFALSERFEFVQCVPRVADRSVVARPRLPLFVPGGEELRIYVSSPIWIQIRTGKPWRDLHEVPTVRLSDTWFGSPAGGGALAYALRTQARVRLDQVPMRPHRVVTPVRIRNERVEPLAIERLNLPVPYLSVYASKHGHFWTETVRMTHTEGSDLAQLKVGKGPPASAEGAKRLSEPRDTTESSVLVRAFSTLLQPLVGRDE